MSLTREEQPNSQPELFAVKRNATEYTKSRELESISRRPVTRSESQTLKQPEYGKCDFIKTLQRQWSHCRQ